MNVRVKWWLSLLVSVTLLTACDTSAPAPVSSPVGQITAEAASVIVEVTSTPSAIASLTNTPTDTPTNTATSTPTSTPSDTPRPTNTLRLPTNTPRPPTNTPLPPTSTPTQGIATTGDVRVFLVGFEPSAGKIYEHVHLVNCDSKPIAITGWQVRNPRTGHVFTFPNFVATPGCGGAVQVTVNTHKTGFEDANRGIFTWGLPGDKEEWSVEGGSVELYNATGALVVRCTYNPAVVAAPGDAYCR